MSNQEEEKFPCIDCLCLPLCQTYTYNNTFTSNLIEHCSILKSYLIEGDTIITSHLLVLYNFFNVKEVYRLYI